PCLESNRSKTDGKNKDVAGKPFQVRRKVEIAQDDANTTWEFTDTDFTSPLKSVCVEEPATLCEVSKQANGVDSCTQIKDNIENVVPSSEGVYVADVHNEDNKDAISNQVRNMDDMIGYVNSRVRYFVGKSLAFLVVQNYVNNTLGKFGLQKVMRNDDGVFMFKFASKEGLDQKGEVTSVPVWVKLHGVPILAYSEDGLSLIATQIGKPLLLDAFISSMCVKSWSQINFARALIEVSSKYEFKSKVTMVIPNEEGDGYTKEVIRVEYEWKPPHCGDCKIFEHDLLQCPKHVKETIFNNPSKVGTSTATDTSSDGFTDLTRKKIKGM
ncbi:reverse transcriptase domain-containing protein, partial [Tanacetum coccineum]